MSIKFSDILALDELRKAALENPNLHRCAFCGGRLVGTFRMVRTPAGVRRFCGVLCLTKWQEQNG